MMGFDLSPQGLLLLEVRRKARAAQVALQDAADAASELYDLEPGSDPVQDLVVNTCDALDALNLLLTTWSLQPSDFPSTTKG